MRRRFTRRSAISTVQWVVVASLVVLAVFSTVQLIGPRTNTKLNQTASDLANPAELTKHMGS